MSRSEKKTPCQGRGCAFGKLGVDLGRKSQSPLTIRPGRTSNGLPLPVIDPQRPTALVHGHSANSTTP